MSAPALRLVVDTNVLLDCWAFDDPRARPLWQAIEASRCRCLRSADTEAELRDVLARPEFTRRLAARGSDAGTWLAAWTRIAQPVERVFAAPWACTDRHDQKFLDLAASGRAELLVTKDKALLKVGRRARAAGLQIADVAAALARLAAAG